MIIRATVVFAFTCGLVFLIAMAKLMAMAQPGGETQLPEGQTVYSVEQKGIVTDQGLLFGGDADAAIRQQMALSRPDIKIESISASRIPGIYAVKMAFGPTLYVSADGQHFIQGDMWQITEGGFINIAEIEREQERADQLAALDVNDAIVFPAVAQTKSIIYIFTDVDCGYCQKLHREVPDLNKAGIEVRYLAYPRAGIGSKTFNQMTSAWCSKDKGDALTKLKNRRSIPAKVCEDSPVTQQYALGQSMGVTGTPYIITQDGLAIPGYVPHERLASMLN